MKGRLTRIVTLLKEIKGILEDLLEIAKRKDMRERMK